MINDNLKIDLFSFHDLNIKFKKKTMTSSNTTQ